MSSSSRLIAGILITLWLGLPWARADAAPFSTGSVAGPVGNVQADFDVVGGNLRVTLSYLTGEILNPAQVLTALLFDLAGNPTLTPVSAVLGGSTVLFDPDGQPPGGVVGGEFDYNANVAIAAPFTFTGQGISSAGFGIFGQADFPGANLDGPTAVGGMQYGLISAIDCVANLQDNGCGNAPVTGGNPLIQSSVVFELSGLPQNFDPSNDVLTVRFLFGTALGETESPCLGSQCPAVPTPATLLLLGAGLIALAGLGRILRKSGTKS